MKSNAAAKAATLFLRQRRDCRACEWREGQMIDLASRPDDEMGVAWSPLAPPIRSA